MVFNKTNESHPAYDGAVYLDMNRLKFLSGFMAVRVGLSLAMVLLMLLHVSGIGSWSALNKLELFAYDTRLTMTMPNSVDEQIVVIDIDEKSLKQQGHWPWPRNKLAGLVDTLFDDYQVAVLGMDMVFAEPDLSSGLQGMQAIQHQHFSQDSALAAAIDKLSPSLDYDLMFANSLNGRKVVLGYVFLQDGVGGEVGSLPAPVLSASVFKGQPVDLMQAAGYSGNLPALQAHAYAAGHINASPDQDGISRKLPMLVQYRDQVYEAFSSAVARAATAGPSMPSANVPSAILADAEWLKIANNSMPVSGEMAALIPYRGVQGSFRYVSATDVLARKVDKALLKNKVVLLGTTAAGLMDLRATPMQNVYPGVEVQASMIAGILAGNIKQQPAYTQGAEFVLLLLLGLLLALALPKLSPGSSSVLTLLCLGCILDLNVWAWQQANLVLPLATPLVLVVALYFFNMAYGFFFESRLKRQLSHLFGQYIPPVLVEEMAKNPQSFSLASQSREMTVLFSDVRDFTAIAEALDPQQLSLFMNQFLSPMTQLIHQHRGSIDKYMGDAIMAFWGAPMPDNQHAKHALQAALAMTAALSRLQSDFAVQGWPSIRIGIGLNTGEMVVGNMGSTFRMAYTVLGDAVNLGSRLEGLTKYYGVDIILSEHTKTQVPEYVYRELDRVRVKGRAQPLAIFEPIALLEHVDADTLAHLNLHHEALALYRRQDWDGAEPLLLRLQKWQPQSGLYALYLERMAHFRENPPSADWDGVFNFEKK